MDSRSEFSSKIGFILAAAGSAVGLGNIWRFPYLVAQHGGGLFVLTYIILLLFCGHALMTAEIAIGRKTSSSPIGAYSSLHKKAKNIGILAVLVPALIVPYYSVIGGWIFKYFVVYISGGHVAAAQDHFFSGFISNSIEPILWQGIFVLITAFIVFKGVKDGIEKMNKFMMPALIILCVAIAAYNVTLPGASEGFKYYLIPDFSKFSIAGVLAALGQMFYSLSLGMGIMITYGSYLNKKEDIEKSVNHILAFDLSVSLLAGAMIVPAVFVFSGGNEQALSTGPSLMFVTLPKVFESMGLSGLVGSAFFLMVLFAAFTSSISLMEVVVSTLCDYKIPRKVSVVITTVFVVLMGIPSSLGNGIWSHISILNLSILDFFDFITNAVMMPIGALLTCILIGYTIGTRVIGDEIKLSSQFKREKMFNVIVKYIAPIFIVVVLISSVLSTYGIIKM